MFKIYDVAIDLIQINFNQINLLQGSLLLKSQKPLLNKEIYFLLFLEAIYYIQIIVFLRVLFDGVPFFFLKRRRRNFWRKNFNFFLRNKLSCRAIRYNQK